PASRIRQEARPRRAPRRTPRVASPPAPAPSGPASRGARAPPSLRPRARPGGRTLRLRSGPAPRRVLPDEEIVENRLLQMHPILGLGKDYRLGPLHHVFGDLLSAMRREAVHHESRGLGHTEDRRVDLIRAKDRESI